MMNVANPRRVALLSAIFLTVGLSGSAWGQVSPALGKARVQLKAWRALGHIQHPAITECSGMVASRQYADIFWVHNDSGHLAVLYAIRRTGELVAEVPVAGAKNIDWEDIAADDEGFLYIADSGNNFAMFPIRSIYKVVEPDPFATPVQPATVVQRFKYAYQDERFDAEGLFVRAGTIWLVSKPRGARSAIYRLEPGQNGKMRPVQVAQLPMPGATAADLSPDGKTLIVATHYTLTVMNVTPDGAPRDSSAGITVRFPPGEVEACCFDGSDVLVTSEKGDIYRIFAADLAAGTRFVKPQRLRPH